MGPFFIGVCVLPLDALAESVAKIYGDTVHHQGHDHQNQACGRCVQMKLLLGSRHPVKHLDRHGAKRREKPFKGNKGKFRFERRVRQECNKSQSSDRDQRRAFTDGPR